LDDLWVLIFIGFFTTFVGTLAGGGGLIGLPSMLLIGIPIHQAIATAKFANIFSSFSTFVVLLKNKNIKHIIFLLKNYQYRDEEDKKDINKMISIILDILMKSL